ncbi:hypothetical protein F7Q99_01290 [Streptomyces kaniharaensis]|uniref:Secreted protein n=1 Tax=Streptomyces kaniharaensis TaxID=212423 RepID=A0A6N7KKS4_9ACTN|nr:hypothetical protein [Streptomyces kaniharaensis]MQS10947.1 hypothetical protein [Streptomyces kaniharaensis]
MRSIARAAVIGTIVGAVAVSGIVGAVAADGGAAVAAAASADTPPPPAVEDFAYPGADQIFKDRGIKLKSGDGNIILAATCSPGMLEIDARPINIGRYCFTTTGASGRLSLELPSTVGVSTPVNYSARVVLVTGTETKIQDLKPGTWTGVGETTDPQQRSFTTLEITTTLVK